MCVSRLSVAYIGPKLRTERLRKTKIGTEVAHVTWLGHHFQGQNFKGQLAVGEGILWWPPAQLVKIKCDLQHLLFYHTVAIIAYGVILHHHGWPSIQHTDVIISCKYLLLLNFNVISVLFNILLQTEKFCVTGFRGCLNTQNNSLVTA